MGTIRWRAHRRRPSVTRMGHIHQVLHVPAEEPPPPPSEPTTRDVAAFRALFELHFDGLAGYVYRYVDSVEEAEDVVHDVFLRVWELRDRINLHRDLRGYLYTLARNQAVDRLRRRRVRSRYIPPELVEPTAPIEGEMQVAASDLAATIRRAVAALPQRQREVLALRWYEQASYDEIAARLGISPKTVDIHLGRAMKRLRETLPRLLE